MPVINNPVLNKYKTYYQEKVKGKDGVIRPLTKVKYVKPCPQCGGSMGLIKYIKATYSKPAKIRWECTDKNCKHSEQELNQREDLRIKAEEYNKPGLCLQCGIPIAEYEQYCGECLCEDDCGY